MELVFEISLNYPIKDKLKIQMDEIYFDIINSNNNLIHMNLLLDGVVDFCSIEVEDIYIRPIPINIEDAIYKSLEIYRSIVDGKNILVKVNIDERTRGDSDKLIWCTD